METRFFDSPNCTGYNPSQLQFRYASYYHGDEQEDLNPRIAGENDPKKRVECLLLCSHRQLNIYGELECAEGKSYYATWVLDTKHRGKTVSLNSFFMIILYIGLVPFGTLVVFWGPVTAMRKQKDPKVKKITVVQVTPAANPFTGVGVGQPRRKAKI